MKTGNNEVADIMEFMENIPYDAGYPLKNMAKITEFHAFEIGKLIQGGKI